MRILLVNPPVYDFSAYDFWLKPYGMLCAAGTIGPGAQFAIFDFMDRGSDLMPAVKEKRPDEFGRGKFFEEEIAKPAVLANIPRRYHRFGIPRKSFKEWLASQEKFEAVLVQTIMTYWYRGVKEVIEDVKEICPGARIILGGPYATICPGHAAEIGADLVIRGGQLGPLYQLLGTEPQDGGPVWDVYSKLATGVMTTTRGCPYKCTYCAAAAFGPEFKVKPVERLTAEFDTLVKMGASNIAFYDDALLFGAKDGLLPFLQHAVKAGVNFHTPNAMHARLITEEIAAALVEGGFKTFHLGFESNSADWHAGTGAKIKADEFEHAVKNLIAAGAQPRHIIAYIMLGHPKSDLQQVEETLKFVNGLGVRSMLAEFSPIPGTPDAQYAEKIVDLSEPLNHNKTAWPIVFLGEEKVNRLKQLCKTLNQTVG